MRAKLTCLVPCKNEAANIEACIESFREIADEVLIADSGSTDETKEIVRALGGCKLIEREFVNYADFKNWAIPQAANEWVLIVDADERITPELAAEIRALLDSPPANIDGYWIYRRSFFLGHEIKHCGWDTDCVFRLIRRDRCRYGACRVHEEIFIAKDRTADLKAKMLHYTYWSYDQYFAKYQRYTQWVRSTCGIPASAPARLVSCSGRSCGFSNSTCSSLVFSTAWQGFKSACSRRFLSRSSSKAGCGRWNTLGSRRQRGRPARSFRPKGRQTRRRPKAGAIRP